MQGSGAKSVVVTGASGFIGRALVSALAADAHFVCRAGYRAVQQSAPGAEAWSMGDLTDHPDLRVLSGADCVVHTVARTHSADQGVSDVLTAYRRINVTATVDMARAAAAVGVRRFVFLSSVKVNGEATAIDRPFRDDDVPAPEDSYGLTKLEAEQGLRQIERETGLDVVILRLPLTYGPGVKGNLARLVRGLGAGMPLPLGAVRNLRSLIGIDNVVSAVLCALESPAAAGRSFLLSDQHDLSTPDLLGRIAVALGRRPRLFPVPSLLLEAGGRLLGRGEEIRRLTGSLRVDSSGFSAATGWRPVVSVDSGLAAMIRAEASGGTKRQSQSPG